MRDGGVAIASGEGSPDSEGGEREGKDQRLLVVSWRSCQWKNGIRYQGYGDNGYGDNG